MGILESIVGHDLVRNSLVAAWRQQRLPNQLLFVGPEGIGKKLFAWGLAELLLCERASEKGSACGLCSSCIKIRSHFHENVFFIEPDKNLIKLDKAREIQDYLSLAQDRGVRFIIVDDAHSLNAQASNALLKIFEEPPPQTYFIFITHRWTQVLPTIRSRATRIAFAPLSKGNLSRWSGYTEEDVRDARGSVAELLKKHSEEGQAFKTDSVQLLTRLMNEKDYFVLGDWRDSLKEKDRLLFFSRYVLLALNEALTARFQTSPSGGTRSQGARAFEALSTEHLWMLWERGLSLEAGVLGHRDPALLIEEWLLPVFDQRGI